VSGVDQNIRRCAICAGQPHRIRAQIGYGGAGRCMDPWSTPADWVHTIRDLLSNRDTYDYISDAASEQARHHLSWDSWAEGIELLLRQSLAQTADNRGIASSVPA